MLYVCIGLSVRNLNEETARIIHDGSPRNGEVARDKCEDRAETLMNIAS
jgi:hypothetical protein